MYMRVSIRHGPKAMLGDTPQERYLNWYLTKQFIAMESVGHIPDKGVMPDECLREARHIIEVLGKPDGVLE